MAFFLKRAIEVSEILVAASSNIAKNVYQLSTLFFSCISAHLDYHLKEGFLFLTDRIYNRKYSNSITHNKHVPLFLSHGRSGILHDSWNNST